MPFLLYDTVTIDKSAFDCMLGARPSIQGWRPAPASVAVLEKLASDGHIELRDYSAAFDDAQTMKLLDQALEYDLSDPSILVPARESLRLWMQFYKDLLGLSDTGLARFHHILASLDDGTPNAGAFRYVYECLADINRVLIVSQVLDKPIYEWEDYARYYRYKYLRACKQTPDRTPGQAMQELFQVFIPGFRIESYSQLCELRDDYRLQAVRDLARHIGDKPIDQGLVIQACEDVLRAKEWEGRFTKYIGLAFGLLPGFIGAVGQAAISPVLKKWAQRKVQWQAFFVERAITYGRKDVESRLRDIAP